MEINTSKPFIIVIPKGLNKRIIESQIMDKFSLTESFFLNRGNYDLDVDPNKVIHSIFDCAVGSVIYSRSIYDFIYMYFFSFLFRRKFLFHYDFRGLISEESYIRSQSKFRKMVLSQVERFIFRNAHKICSVSENLASELRNRFGNRDVSVEACKIDSKYLVRKTTRSFDDSRKVHFVYLGSLAPWQGFDEVLRVFSKLQTELPCFLSVVTNEVDKADHLCKVMGVTEARCFSLDRSEVFSFLDSVDFGFLMRSNSLVNRTSSPVKFAEYISRGVIPIITPFVGDYSKQAESFSYIIDELSPHVNAERLLSMRNDRTYDEIYRFASDLVW